MGSRARDERVLAAVSTGVHIMTGILEGSTNEAAVVPSSYSSQAGDEKKDTETVLRFRIKESLGLQWNFQTGACKGNECTLVGMWTSG